MKTVKYLFISDPGHGWLAVPAGTIRKLGLAQDISCYSYVSASGNTVYCEEDQDAGIVIKALREKGIEVKFREVNNAHNYSSVREMRSYTPSRIGVLVISDAAYVDNQIRAVL
jgi:hypothetical protein